MVQTITMIVTIANSARMIIDQQCKALHFRIQGQEFVKDMRVLDIQGYDLIL
jgi:Retroviral aspartyl protease